MRSSHVPIIFPVFLFCLRTYGNYSNFLQWSKPEDERGENRWRWNSLTELKDMYEDNWKNGWLTEKKTAMMNAMHDRMNEQLPFRVEEAWMWSSLWRSLWIWFWTSWNKSALEIFKKDSGRLINMKVWNTKVEIKTRQAGQWILGKEYCMVHSWCWEVPSGLIGKCWPCKVTKKLQYRGKWTVNPVKTVFLQELIVNRDHMSPTNPT